MYAIIKTGGKQYRVAPGDIVKVEKLPLAPGATTVQINQVFMLVNDRDVTMGSPVIPNARVLAEVLEQGRDPKIVVFKMKRRKGYRRTIGHRQHYTTLRISEIALGDTVHRAKANGKAATAPAARKIVAPVPAPPPVDTAPVSTSTEPAKPREASPGSPPAKAAPAPQSTPGPDTAASLTAEAPAAPPPARPDEAPADARQPAIVAPTVTTPPPPRTTVAAPTPAPAPTADAIEAPARRDRRYWLAAALAVLLLAAAGFFFIGPREQAPEEIAPIAAPTPEHAAPPQAAQPKPALADPAIEEPAAVSAPSAPAQPPD